MMAEEDFSKVSVRTEAKSMLETVREFWGRFFSLEPIAEKLAKFPDVFIRDVARKEQCQT
jgi:hypothetical protein